MKIEPDGDELRVVWPLSEVETGELVLDFSGRGPLIRKMTARMGTRPASPILTHVDPAWYLTVGSRRLAAEKPPEQQWEVFFDNPHQRPHETHVSKLAIGKVRVTGKDKRAVIAIDGLAVGPFAGAAPGNGRSFAVGHIPWSPTQQSAVCLFGRPSSVKIAN